MIHLRIPIVKSIFVFLIGFNHSLNTEKVPKKYLLHITRFTIKNLRKSMNLKYGRHMVNFKRKLDENAA